MGPNRKAEPGLDPIASYNSHALAIRLNDGEEMGITNVKATVGNPADSSRTREVEFLVDSAATYSLVPSEILSELEIEPHSVREFALGNGEFVKRRMGTATFEYLGVRGDSLVMFGEPGDAPLLGATTLEGFGFILDPFRRELKPLPMRF